MQYIFDTISTAQRGAEGALLQLVKQFQPLLKKYAQRLNYEDAYSDLQAKFIEIIKSIPLAKLKNAGDPYLLCYIKKSVQHHSILLAQRQQESQKMIAFSALSTDDEDQYAYFEDKLLSVTDEYPQIEFDFLTHVLTRYESEIILCFYYYHYPAKMIAQMHHVSAPAISQAKANAIKKLKKYMLSENIRKGALI